VDRNSRGHGSIAKKEIDHVTWLEPLKRHRLKSNFPDQIAGLRLLSGLIYLDDISKVERMSIFLSIRGIPETSVHFHFAERFQHDPVQLGDASMYSFMTSGAFSI
jgi:hypothetical protein